MILIDLRTQLASLDDEIDSLRSTINPPGSPLRELVSISHPTPAPTPSSSKYDKITDAAKLTRLVKAKEKTKQLLESKAGWAAMDQSKAADEASETATV